MARRTKKRKTQDNHGAQKSGEKVEVSIKDLLQAYDPDYVRNTEWLPAPPKLKSSGYHHFIPDAESPWKLKSWVEVKGGSTNGSTEEKIWFTMRKIEAGVYDEKTIQGGKSFKNLLIIFQGTVERNANSVDFMKEIEKKKSDGDLRYANVECVLASEITSQEMYDNIFSRRGNVAQTALNLYDD
jgi:hypothetical protein